MDSNCIYVFDSSTANEAALAVKEGHYDSIIHYHIHSNKQHANQSSNHHANVMPPKQPGYPGSQYEQDLCPERLKERESKLNRLTQLAANLDPVSKPPQPPQMQQQQSQQHRQQQQQQQQHLDPLSSMALLSECPNTTDAYRHTVHHLPPS